MVGYILSMRCATQTKGNEMKKETIINEISEMKIGHTGSKWGVIVSRHGADCFELGTWGVAENRYTAKEAAEKIIDVNGR